MDAYDLGLRLKGLREKYKLSQTQVATRLNLSRSAIANYESNTSFPSTDVVTKFALLYHTSTDYILGLENRTTITLDGLTPSQEDDLLKVITYSLNNSKLKKYCSSSWPLQYFYSYKSNLYLYFFLGYIKRGPHYLILIMCKIQK